MLIAMAGLPGTGKSRLGRALARRLPGTILDKDQVRAALFRPEDIEYSTAQDDLCVSIMLQVAAYLLSKNADTLIILDGRPFARRYQRAELVTFAATHRISLCLIECVCSDETARRRLEGGGAHLHLARNRDFALYQQMKAQFEPITEPRLLIDTDRNFQRNLARALTYIRARPGVELVAGSVANTSE